MSQLSFNLHVKMLSGTTDRKIYLIANSKKTDMWYIEKTSMLLEKALNKHIVQEISSICAPSAEKIPKICKISELSCCVIFHHPHFLPSYPHLALSLAMPSKLKC